MTTWISVEERLPDTPRPVWMWMPSFDKVRVGYFANGLWLGWIKAITHWAEIDWPDPPEKPK